MTTVRWVVAASFALLLAGCGGGSSTRPAGEPAAGSPEPRSVTALITSRGYFNSCYSAAQREGFFAREGIKVNTLIIDASAATQAVVAGEASIGFVNLDYLQTAGTAPAERLPMIVAGQANAPLFSLVGAPSLSSIQDLRGKTVALGPEGSSTTLVAEKVLNDQLGKGTWKALYAGGGTSGRVAALDAGRAEAAVASAPTDLQLEAAGHYRRIASLAKFAPDVTTAAMVANRQWPEKNRETATRFVRAYRQGCAWLYDKTNRDAVIDMMAKDAELKPAVAEKQYDSYLLGPLSGNTPPRDGKVSRSGVQALLELFRAAGTLKGDVKDVDLGALIDDSVYAKAG